MNKKLKLKALLKEENPALSDEICSSISEEAVLRIKEAGIKKDHESEGQVIYTVMCDMLSVLKELASSCGVEIPANAELNEAVSFLSANGLEF